MAVGAAPQHSHPQSRNVIITCYKAVAETAYLYDAVHLYEASLLRALDENRDPRNGREMVSALYGVHYRSAMGYVYKKNTKYKDASAGHRNIL